MRIRRRAARILSGSGLIEAEWSILLTDDEEQSALNKTFRGKPHTTDVLSFPAGDPRHPAILGDVSISLQQAARQCSRGALEAEVVRLLAHGLCHLLGYEHQRSSDRRKMKAAETLLLEPFGLESLIET